MILTGRKQSVALKNYWELVAINYSIYLGRKLVSTKLHRHVGTRFLSMYLLHGIIIKVITLKTQDNAVNPCLNRMWQLDSR